MPLVAADIQKRLSGGATNTNVNLSLGGIKSSTAIVDASLHNLFDIVSSAEASAGDTEYRCFYFHNAHATLTALSSKVWIQTNTPSAGTTVEIGIGSAAINAEEQSVANESTAPTGVTFSAAAIDLATGLVIGDLLAGQHRSIWVKRIVTAGAAAANADSVLIRFGSDTNA